MDPSEQAAELRREAEARLRRQAAPTPGNLEAGLTLEEARRLLHELQVHQIELEFQNDELRRTQAELEASRASYFDLYELAPVGYCTVSEKGLILEANLTAANLLGEARGSLVGQPISRYVLAEDQDVYYLFRRHLFKTGTPRSCELRLLKRKEHAFWASLEGSAAWDAEGNPVYRVVLSDITERKRLEMAARRLAERMDVLALLSERFAEAPDERAILDVLVHELSSMFGGVCLVHMLSEAEASSLEPRPPLAEGRGAWTVPLWCQGRPLGSLSLDLPKDKPPPSEEDLQFLNLVGRRAAQAIHNVRQLERARRSAPEP